MSTNYTWTQVTDRAAFAGRDGAGALVLNNRMWLLGGWNPDDKPNFPLISNNEIWSSADGKDWKLETRHAPWEARHCAGYVVHNGKMWILGGDTTQRHYQNDVWCSDDGVTWEQVTSFAPWAPRLFHYAVSHAGKLWVMGGQTLLKHLGYGHERYYTDVWCTEDGRNWEQVLDKAPWKCRGMISGSAVHNGRIWLLGGGTFENPYHMRTMYREVWSSADGVKWTQHPDAPWLNRQFHEVATFDHKLWVLEGVRLNYDLYSDGVGPDGGNLNDVWFSDDGERWTEVPNTPWAKRHAASVFVYQDALWMVAGNHMGRDVWKLTRTK